MPTKVSLILLRRSTCTLYFVIYAQKYLFKHSFCVFQFTKSQTTFVILKNTKIFNFLTQVPLQGGATCLSPLLGIKLAKARM